MIESLINSKVSPVENICQFRAEKKAFSKSMLTIFLFMYNKVKLALFGFYAMVTIHSLNLGNRIIYQLCQLSCVRHAFSFCARPITFDCLHYILKDEKGLFGTYFTILEKLTI